MLNDDTWNVLRIISVIRNAMFVANLVKSNPHLFSFISNQNTFVHLHQALQMDLMVTINVYINYL